MEVDVEVLVIGIEHAQRYGMLTEFLRTYFNELNRGVDSITAVRDALHEWDL